MADEDCFDCVFTSKVSNRISSRDRASTTIAAPTKKHRFVVPVPSRPSRTSSNVEETSTTTTTSRAEEGSETEGEGEGAKQAINCPYCPSNCCCYHGLMQPCDLLQQSLLYWQEYLPQPKTIFKA